MQIALLATALAIFGYLLARAVVQWRRAKGARRAGVRVPPGCIEILDLPLRHLAVNGRSFPFVGVTSREPRGFSHVPPGKHRVILVIAGEARAVCALVRSGETTRLVRGANGAIVAIASGKVPAEIDGSYIHFPTWARGPRSLLTGVSTLEDA